MQLSEGTGGYQHINLIIKSEFVEQTSILWGSNSKIGKIRFYLEAQSPDANDPDLEYKIKLTKQKSFNFYVKYYAVSGGWTIEARSFTLDAGTEIPFTQGVIQPHSAIADVPFAVVSDTISYEISTAKSDLSDSPTSSDDKMITRTWREKLQATAQIVSRATIKNGTKEL